MTTSKIIGIDLGTTNSCVAVLDSKGHATILVGLDNERTIPSWVSWNTSGQATVGTRAKRQAVTNASATVFGVKRLIGRKVNADDVSWFARLAPFRIVAAPNGDAWVRIHGQPVSPQEVAAQILRRVRAVAEEALGEPVTRAVVTVPAYFDDAQRQATRDAGQIAGLDIVRILNEPTAAALAYGAHRAAAGRRIIAVFDLGGGTFDISIMSVDNGIFEVLATGGDSALGGEDWDRRLLERVVDEVFDQYRVDLTGIPMAMSRLREACENAKKALSTDREALIQLPFLANDQHGAPINFEKRITREQVESLTKDLLDRLEAPCRRALADATLGVAEIEEILLVGGMTRWPAVQDVVEQIFGKKPSKGANPDEVVAQGAAAYAGILAGEADDAALLDVTPHDIGIKVGDSQFAVVLPRNSMLPVRARRLFASREASVTIRPSGGLSQREIIEIINRRRQEQSVTQPIPIEAGSGGSVRVTTREHAVSHPDKDVKDDEKK